MQWRSDPMHANAGDRLLPGGNRHCSLFYKEEAARNFERFQTVFLACQDIRRSGSAALDLCYVAVGGSTPILSGI